MKRCLIPIFYLLGFTLAAIADLPDPNGWWKLDEGIGSTAYDSSGDGYHGTIYGTPGWETDFLFENVLNFNGSTNQVKVPGYWGVSGGQSRTVCAWIKTTQLSGGIVNYGSNVDGGRWLFILDGNGKLQLGISGGNIISTQVVADGQWHHAAAVLEAPAEGPTLVQHLRLYIDGLPAAGTYTNPDTEISTVLEYPVRIGVVEGPAGTLGSYFAGQIHDVRMYDTALSEEEIQQFFLEDLDLVGSGTSEDPYQITTAEQLVLIGTIPAFLDDCFVLNNDIVFDLNIHRDYIFSRAVIAPDVGLDKDFAGTPFTGVFDGNHHTIRNLTIIGFNIEYIGLFGKCESAVIKNLVLEDVYIYAWTATDYPYCYVGGLAGQQVNSTISGCSADGSIDITTDIYVTLPCTGGLVGYQDGGLIIECSTFLSAISTAFSTRYGYDPINPQYPTYANSFAGGLVGYQNSGTIEDCYATGSTEALSERQSFAGGLIGYQNDGSIKYSYAMGPVEASANSSSYAGGLVGYKNSGTIEHCYATGPVEATTITYSYAGGLVGYQNSGTIENCYASSYVLGYRNKYSSDYPIYCCAGGLVGASRGSIYNCYANSITTSSTLDNLPYAGGLVGRTEGIISDCYALGSASALQNNNYYSYSCGGLVGCNVSGIIKRSFAACTVLGDDNRGCGLVGYQEKSSAIAENCFWDIPISRKNIGCYRNYGTISNVFGKTTVEMQEFDTFIPIGWDFVGEEENGTNNIWRMCVDGMDYPRLSWEYGQNGDFTCPDGVGLEDLESLAYHWLTADGHPDFNYATDGSGDGFIGQEDMTILSKNWLTELWAGPVIHISRQQVAFGLEEGQTLSVKELRIANFGSGILNWAIESEEPIPGWLSIDPVSGTLGRGEGQPLTLSVDISGLSIGDYEYTFDVVDPNALNSPQTVTVRLVVAPPLPVPGAYWALDEEDGTTADDSSGNGHPGTLVNFADPDSSWTAGKVGNCLAFDGSNDRVDVNGYTGIGGSQPRTTCAWIKLASDASTGNILSYGGSDLRSSWLFLVNGDGKLQLGVNGGNMIGDPVLAAGRWVHVAAVLADWDSDGMTVGDLRLYIDGQEVSGTYTNPNEVLFTGDTYPVRIGTHVSVSNSFSGRIDEVRMYDTALSAGQIALLAAE